MIRSKGASSVEKYNIDKIKQDIQETINTTLENGINDRGLSLEELEKRKKRNALLQENLRNCGLGDLGAKEFVKSYIKDLLSQKLDEKNIDNVIEFNNHEKLSVQDKFEILLNTFKQKYKYDAFSKFIEKNKFDKLRESNHGKKYFISSRDIDVAYKAENIELSFQDKLEIITQRIYQENNGLGVIDEIRDMNINGLSIGVSGIPKSFLSSLDIDTMSKEIDLIPKSYDSVWLDYEGKEIHLEFMSFGSYEELERVCKLSYKFNDPGSLSSKEPYIFNTTADNCRVAVFRPPFCESWVCFLRKFNIKGELSNLIHADNSEDIIKLSEYIVKGEQTVAITGQQRAGKTTFMKGLIRKILPIYTLRVSEGFFELHLRNAMPDRNIMTIQELYEISRDEALDSFKKASGAVTIISEAAEDEDIKFIIKVAQVASRFTLFTHHAKTFDDLIKSLRNSLLNVKLFNSESLAEEQIVSALGFNIHLEITAEGERYIERITECVPIEDEEFNTEFMEESDLGNRLNKFMVTTLEFFEKMNTKKKYKSVNILEYNLDTGKYEFKNNISETRRKEMEKKMLKEDRENFRKFCKEVLEGNATSY